MSATSGIARLEDELVLKARFFALMIHLQIHHVTIGGAWSFIEYEYSAPWRTYHNLAHLSYMFRSADKLGWKLSPEEQLAIFYHDVIYRQGAADNEEQSAEYCHQLSRPRDKHGNAMTWASIDLACQIILQTAHHLRDNAPDYTQQVMDLDLASFAEPDYSRFLDVNARVRAEFDINQRVHSQFLSKFLERERIYYQAGDEWEKTARKNIARYIEDSK